MKHLRRAASPVAPSALVSVLGVGVLFASVAAALGVRIAGVARRVVTPAPRVADVEILGIDRAAQTITLSRTPDTELPGRYGVFTNGAGYVKLGAVLGQDDRGVTRKLLSHVDAGTRVGPHASFSGWYFDEPEQLHLPFSTHAIETPVGPAPAWLFPAGTGDVWAVLVHGRGTTRAETLRAVPVLHAAGISSLVVSYRNDGEAPRSRTGLYGLGATEWRDADDAIGWALENGARRIVLMGWSMGGAVVLQAAVNSAHREAIAGIVLESPVVDWRVVLDFHARELGVPDIAARAAMGTLGTPWTARAAGAGRGIPFDELDMVARADELTAPILLLHSDDDGFVPSSASRALADARPDIVTLEGFTVARHTKLWNYDESRWTAAIRGWLAANGLGASR
ncbi:alpha/beta hydrolase family protein [Microbacterium marinilacus]|uniref:Alpha/beta fold hydrolase n=1 Tax=Microbacterium marinilacus TaxID=415209 RepID=A0ABP7B1J8_9MICO|nr:alpha/beta fold hydrolase [Microbacterium marinilacus]MBY0688780.1 lysophospholipase [Microbacterium marinilacus]